MSVARLEVRVSNLTTETSSHSEANRLSKRLEKYGSKPLTFLWYDDNAADNNAGERTIRPAVMIRKNGYCNHSERGARTQLVLMTIFRTLKARNHQPLDTVLAASAPVHDDRHSPAAALKPIRSITRLDSYVRSND